MRVTEQNLEAWRRKPSDHEKERYDWTRESIANAFHNHTFGDDEKVAVYAKGSYPNFTNVRLNSDVDIALELQSVTRHDFIHDAVGMRMEDFGFSPYTGDYDTERLKNEAVAVLERAFPGAVHRSNKCIEIRESRSGLQADVVPCQSLMTHVGPGRTVEGIRIFPDNGGWIDNYPQRRLDEGIAKNTRTRRRYKRVVRMAKVLNSRAAEEKLTEKLPSYLIESLIWNVEPRLFSVQPWKACLFEVLDVCLHTYKEESNWMEADNFKFLFHPNQSWTEHGVDRVLRDTLSILDGD